MDIIFQSQVLYQNEEFIGACTTVQGFNCGLMQGTPRVAWLTRQDGEEQYKVTFDNPLDNNALQGVWVSVGGLGTLLNVKTVAEVLAACNACCGSTPALTPAYATIPAFVSGVAATYTITRQEDNSAVALEDFALDYMRYIITGTLLRTAYNAGTGIATYTFSSYKDPIALGPDVLHSTIADVITGETARVFTSNIPGALPGGMTNYSMVVQADGTFYPAKLATTLAGMVTAANADAALSLLGTWSTSGGAMVLTTTSVYGANIVVGFAA